MDTAQLVAQFPQFALLILAAIAYKWLHIQHRAEREARSEANRQERAARDADWRMFLDHQRQEFGRTIERVVAEFRESVAEDRELHAAEFRKLGDSLAAHDAHSQRVAERVAEVLAVKLVETAAKGGQA